MDQEEKEGKRERNDRVIVMPSKMRPSTIRLPGELLPGNKSYCDYPSNAKDISKYEKIRYLDWLGVDYYSSDRQCY